MNRVLSGRLGRLLLLVVPAAGLLIPESLHPDPHALGSVYQSVSPVVDWWIQLHLLLFALFTLLAFAVFVSLDDVQGPAAIAARVALGIFVAATCAFVGTEGIGMGLVIRGAQGLPAAQQAGVDQAVQALWDSQIANALGLLGHLLFWVLSVGATAVALYSSARRRLPLALLGLIVLWVMLAVRVVPVSLPVAAVVSALLWITVVTVVGADDRAAMFPFGLLVVAMLLPQHGDALGAVGAASVGLALVWRELSPKRGTGITATATPATAAPV